MPKLKEVLLEVLLPTVKAVGKLELETILSGIKEHNTPELYQNTLQGLHANFSLLKDVAIKSKSKIDDGIIDLVLEAVAESAANGGVILA